MVCIAFKGQSNSIWAQLRDSRKYNYQIKETTITDLLILGLKKKFSDVVIVKDFSSREESKIGADWEWWFTGISGNWLGFRVQAKILNLSTNYFEELHYENKQGSQCEQLINNSLRNSPSLIPIYCLYANFHRQDIEGVWNPFAINERISSFGVSVVSAYVVRMLRTKYQRQLNHISDVSRFMFPWHLLVCPSLLNRSIPEGSLAEIVFNNWINIVYSWDKEILPGSIKALDNVDLLPSPPDHIATLLKGRSVEELPESIKRITIFSNHLA